jgi:geranylgeranyl transferase type-1 subunit beta
MLGHKTLIARTPSRRFLLSKTQHLIGGFAKHPSDPPDIYHSYLGLAALAIMGGDPALKELDAALCASTDTVRKVEAARAALVRRCRDGR